MKNLRLWVGLLSLPVLVIACSKKEDKKSDGITAPSNYCLANTSCDNAEYNKDAARNGGFSAYNTSVFHGMSYFNFYNTSIMPTSSTYYWGSFCQCGRGAMPVYNEVKGLGCVSLAAIENVRYTSGNTVVYWMLAAGQSNFSAYSGYDAVNQMLMTGDGCSNAVAEACLVSQPEACRGGGLVCRSTANGSPWGLCAR